MCHSVSFSYFVHPTQKNAYTIYSDKIKNEWRVRRGANENSLIDLFSHHFSFFLPPLSKVIFMGPIQCQTSLTYSTPWGGSELFLLLKREDLPHFFATHSIHLSSSSSSEWWASHLLLLLLVRHLLSSILFKNKIIGFHITDDIISRWALTTCLVNFESFGKFDVSFQM